MNEKTTIKLDLSKLDKSRIVTRSYTNKQGQEVTIKEYSIDVVPLKEAETIKNGDGWKLEKNCFLTDSPTKEERADKKKMNIIGNGTAFRSAEVEAVTSVSPEEFPF